jgi:hypothetical protein
MKSIVTASYGLIFMSYKNLKTKILLYYSNPTMVVPINKISKFEVEGVKITKMAACVPCWISIVEE